MSAIQFLHMHFPHVFAKAQKLGMVGQALFDAGRLFEQYYVDRESFQDGDGI